MDPGCDFENAFTSFLGWSRSLLSEMSSMRHPQSILNIFAAPSREIYFWWDDSAREVRRQTLRYGQSYLRPNAACSDLVNTRPFNFPDRELPLFYPVLYELQE